MNRPIPNPMNAEQFIQFLIDKDIQINWKHIETGDLNIAEDYSSSYISYHPGLKSNEVRVILK